jgi:DNA-binding XRE family transcriptional regulator
MKITKYVEFATEVEIDVTCDDIRAAIVSHGTESPAEAIRGLNCIATYMKAITDEVIAGLNPHQRKVVAEFFAAQAARYAEKPANDPAAAVENDTMADAGSSAAQAPKGLPLRPMTMRELIRSRRDARGLTQSMLADQVGCSSQTISDIEAGRRPVMQKRFWPKLAEVLQVDIKEILQSASDSVG